MLTLKAAGLLDVEAGEIIRPGIVRVEDDRIVGIGGEPEGEIIDLGDAILLPGLKCTPTIDAWSRGSIRKNRR